MEEENKRNKSTLAKDPETTGHSWDGIEEFNNPDPFWLRVLFYAMLFFGLVYWVLYPSFPSQRQGGVLNWTAYKETAEGLAEMEKVRQRYQADFDKASFEKIMQDPELLKFALAGGKAAFHNHCAMCHGVGGTGNPGFPNLTAGMWLWGGKIDDIYTTIRYGIRSEHDETRQSQMAAFGRDGILRKDQIEKLVDFVIGMHKGEKGTDEAAALFKENCASCHGANGEGGREFGAPRLNSPIWLYGADRQTVYDVIYNGRQGVMPYWESKLSNSTIRELAVYVHQLGGGE